MYTHTHTHCLHCCQVKPHSSCSLTLLQLDKIDSRQTRVRKEGQQHTAEWKSGVLQMAVNETVHTDTLKLPHINLQWSTHTETAVCMFHLSKLQWILSRFRYIFKSFTFIFISNGAFFIWLPGVWWQEHWCVLFWCHFYFR